MRCGASSTRAGTTTASTSTPARTAAAGARCANCYVVDAADLQRLNPAAGTKGDTQLGRPPGGRSTAASTAEPLAGGLRGWDRVPARRPGDQLAGGGRRRGAHARLRRALGT